LRLIIDTDMGCDDAVAVLLAAREMRRYPDQVQIVSAPALFSYLI
jgi:inosine-uridine nucleoside N-ribohydrolase